MPEEQAGQPPKTRVIPDKRRKPPRHKKASEEALSTGRGKEIYESGSKSLGREKSDDEEDIEVDDMGVQVGKLEAEVCRHAIHLRHNLMTVSRRVCNPSATQNL